MDRFIPHSPLDEAKARFKEQLCWFAISFVFACIAFYYSEMVETDVACWSIEGQNTLVDSSTLGAQNGNQSFQNLFRLWLSLFILLMIRSLLNVFLLKYNHKFLVQAIPILDLIRSLLIPAALILSYKYRLRHSGKVCSGDYLESEDKNDSSILVNYALKRGKFLWNLLVVTWVSWGVCCCGCITLCFVNIKKAYVLEQSRIIAS